MTGICGIEIQVQHVLPLGNKVLILISAFNNLIKPSCLLTQALGHHFQRQALGITDMA